MRFKRNPPPGNVRWVGTTGQNIRGVITNKKGRIVQFESWAERALLLRLDRDPDIIDYGSQPEQFKFTDLQGKPHTYTPDFMVWRKDGRVEIHEVTLSIRRTRAEIVQRELAAETICLSRGWKYIVHTEHTLPQGSELANLLALFRYRPTVYANLAISGAVQHHLSQGNSIWLNHLALELETELAIPRPVILAALGHLLWQGSLQVDLNQPIFRVDRASFAPDIQVWQTSPMEGGLENDLIHP